MQTGEIWLADLDPTEGSEQSGTRPVVIISGNAMNARSGLVIICPLTSKIKHYAGNAVLTPDAINGLSAPSEVLVFQVRTLSSKRLLHKVGEISKDIHTQILKNFIKICTF